MSDKPTKTMCCVEKYAGFDYPRKPCGKPAKVERDGKPYCGVHDPERVKMKRDEREAKRRARFDAETRKFHRQWLEYSACDGVSDDDLRRVIEAGGLAALLTKGVSS